MPPTIDGVGVWSNEYLLSALLAACAAAAADVFNNDVTFILSLSGDIWICVSNM